MKIKNYDEIVEELTDMFKEYDKALNQYQTDFYLYYDEYTQTASLDTFTNVGGNSWLDDDHITIYHDKEHYESIYDFFDSIADIAEALDMSEEELLQAVKDDICSKGYEITDNLEIEPHDVEEYLSYRNDLYEKLFAAYCEQVDDNSSEYLAKAHAILELAEIYELETPKEKDIERE